MYDFNLLVKDRQRFTAVSAAIATLAGLPGISFEITQTMFCIRGAVINGEKRDLEIDWSDKKGHELFYELAEFVVSIDDDYYKHYGHDLTNVVQLARH